MKQEKNTIRFCPECGNKVNPNEIFCGNCGTKVIDSNICLNPNAPIFENSPTKSSNKKFNKRILIPIISILSVMSLFGITLVIFIFLTSTHIICINHDWSVPTCLESAKCTYCDKYKDDVLGNHNWISATCTEPKTCSECSETEGEALGHINGKWTVVEVATFYEAGTEELSCTRCEQVIDSRTIARKAPKVEGKSFNFDDDEFIEWLEDNTTLEVGRKQSLDSDMNTAYLLTTLDGDTGVLVLNHGSNGLYGNVCGIMIYFDNDTLAIAATSLIGEKINSAFVKEDAAQNLIADKSYTKANMTIMMLDLQGMSAATLAPSEFYAELIS